MIVLIVDKIIERNGYLVTPSNWLFNNEKILFYNKRAYYTSLQLNLLEFFIFFLDKKETKNQANIHFLTQKLLKNPKLKKLHFIETVYLV